jgi:ABC-type transporter Mla subunit MlaD
MEGTWQAVVVGIASTAFLGWVVWISSFVLKVNDKANKSLANDAANEKEIDEIGSRWEATAKRLEDGLARIEERLDVFLNNELNTLKEIAKK